MSHGEGHNEIWVSLFFSWLFELQISKFQNPLVMVLSDAPSRRLAPPPGMTAQINICGELAEKVVRLLLRKIIYDWPAGYSGCLGFSEWRLLEGSVGGAEIDPT